MEPTDQPSDLEEKVAAQFIDLSAVVSALWNSVWPHVKKVLPYVWPGAYLVGAIYLVRLMGLMPVSLDARVVCLSILAAVLILSATLLLIAHWYFRRKE